MRVFVGKTQETDMGFPSAIFKSEVFGELWLGPEGLEGDEQASPKIHGGAERALLQYPSIHYDWWKIRYPAKRDLFKPALFGENLSDNRWHEKYLYRRYFPMGRCCHSGQSAAITLLQIVQTDRVRYPGAGDAAERPLRLALPRFAARNGRSRDAFPVCGTYQ